MYIVNERQRNLVAFLMDKIGVVGTPENTDTRTIIETALQRTGKEGVEKLLKYLQTSDFYTAPASTRFHGNYAGALAEHSINVAALFLQKNEQLGLGFPESTCLLAALCHDLCKVNFYTIEYKNQKVYDERGSKSDAKGRYDWQTVPAYGIEDTFPCGHGEKSVIMLQNFLRLTQDEILLIRWHMGPFACANEHDFHSALNFRPEIAALFTADMEASSLLEETR